MEEIQNAQAPVNTEFNETCEIHIIINKEAPKEPQIENKCISKFRNRLFEFCAFSILSQKKRKYRDDNIKSRREKCLWPPPLFFITISIIQLVTFVICNYAYDVSKFKESSLIYNPYRRGEIWRIFTYSFIHTGWIPLLTSIAVQIGLGFQHEVVHVGLHRVMYCLIWTCGIIWGPLMSSVTFPNSYAAGAIGGNYSFLVAIFHNILVGSKNMEYPCLRLLGVIIVPVIDTTWLLLNHGCNYHTPVLNPPVENIFGYGCQVAGVYVGISCMFLTLQDTTDPEGWGTLGPAVMSCIMFGIMFAATLVVFVWNVGFPSYFPLPENELKMYNNSCVN